MDREMTIRQERIQSVVTGLGTKLGNIWWSFLLRGIFAIALGVFALFWPQLSLGVLVFATGLYCIADGAAALVGALAIRTSVNTSSRRWFSWESGQCWSSGRVQRRGASLCFWGQRP